VNKNIIKRNSNKYAILIYIAIFLSVNSLSGCVDNQNTEINDLNKFIGTWTGNLEFPTFNGSDNSTITQIIFTDTFVTTYLTSERGTFSVNYTYKVEGDKLALEPKFDNNAGPFNRQPFNDSLPFNDTLPSYNGSLPPNGTMLPNETWPPNGTIPPNDTWSPNGSRPFKGGQSPYDQRSVMATTFVYSFNKEFNVLYLNDSQFIKIQ
jgi:hypothetical protein